MNYAYLENIDVAKVTEQVKQYYLGDTPVRSANGKIFGDVCSFFFKLNLPC